MTDTPAPDARTCDEPDRAAGPPVLELERTWLYKVTVLADLGARRVSEVVGRVCGLNLSQWRVLAAIADRPGRTSREVVDVTPMDKGLVSRAVGLLVERGLVERRTSPEDGRRAPLHLTPSGTATYREIVAELDATGASGRTLLTGAEEERLLALLDTAIARYRAGEP